MDKKLVTSKHAFLDLVSVYKNVLFNNRRVDSIRQKQEVWKAVHAKMVSRRLVNLNRDWKWTRRQWYYLTHLARRSREQYLLGRIYDIPEFDKKLLMISGIPVAMDEEQTSYAVDRLNMENEREVINSLTIRDNMEITEHKVLFQSPMEDVKSKEMLDKTEIEALNRKVNEQRFKLQQCKLLKRKCEIFNIKNKNEREIFMKLL